MVSRILYKDYLNIKAHIAVDKTELQNTDEVVIVPLLLKSLLPVGSFVNCDLMVIVIYILLLGL